MTERVQNQLSNATKATTVIWSRRFFEKKYEEIGSAAATTRSRGNYIARFVADTPNVDFLPVSFRIRRAKRRVYLSEHSSIYSDTGREIGFWVPCRDRLGGRTSKLLLIKNPQAKQRKGQTL